MINTKRWVKMNPLEADSATSCDFSSHDLLLLEIILHEAGINSYVYVLASTINGMGQGQRHIDRSNRKRLPTRTRFLTLFQFNNINIITTTKIKPCCSYYLILAPIYDTSSRRLSSANIP